MHVSASVYNAAGELVRRLYEGPSQAWPGGFSIDRGAFVAGEGGVAVGFAGTSLTWLGDNDEGQKVGGGVYVLKLDVTDPFGSVESWERSVEVLPAPAAQALDIYNSAGERVARLGAASASGLPLTGLGFRNPDKAVYAPAEGASVEFLLRDAAGAAVGASWDGRSDLGRQVAPGTYTAQLVDLRGGRMAVVSKTFTLLRAAGEAFNALAAPNPAGPGDLFVGIRVGGLRQGEAAWARLYALDGALAESAAPSADGVIRLKLAGLAPGTYMAVLECGLNRVARARLALKIALRR
jgi:hypothetical protein